MSVQWRGPYWLKPFFAGADDTIFHRVTGVELQERVVDDALLELQYLERLHLRSCMMSVEQREKLSRMRSLSSLAQFDIHVSDDVATATANQAYVTLPFISEQILTWPQPCPSETSLVAFACPTKAPAAP